VAHFVSQYGIGVVVVLVFLEAAGGAIVPGETAFIVASALAADGHGDIVRIVVATAASAIVGTVAAYAFGRLRGHTLVSARPWFQRSEAYFRAHGSAALFFGRFVPVLRTTLGWMAGISGIGMARFLLWSVLGCVTWACAVGVAAYYLGEAVLREAAVGIGVVAAIVAALAGMRLLRRRPERA
jgi:membrane-associated protein